MTRPSEWHLTRRECDCGAPLLRRNVATYALQADGPVRVDVEWWCSDADCRTNLIR